MRKELVVLGVRLVGQINRSNKFGLECMHFDVCKGWRAAQLFTVFYLLFLVTPQGSSHSQSGSGYMVSIIYFVYILMKVRRAFTSTTLIRVKVLMALAHHNSLEETHFVGRIYFSSAV